MATTLELEAVSDEGDAAPAEGADEPTEDAANEETAQAQREGVAGEESLGTSWVNRLHRNRIAVLFAHRFATITRTPMGRTACAERRRR